MRRADKGCNYCFVGRRFTTCYVAQNSSLPPFARTSSLPNNNKEKEKKSLISAKHKKRKEKVVEEVVITSSSRRYFYREHNIFLQILPTTQPTAHTLNKLPPELRCRNFVNKHRLSIQISTKRAKTCTQCVHRYIFQLSLPFCIPPLVVG